MPLSTNRLYTHEIQPPSLDVALLPTRMGYVVRCSSAEAVRKDGRTFLKDARGELVELEPPTTEGMAELRRSYAEENLTDAVVDYGRVLFSMNEGDYAEPIVGEATIVGEAEDEFRSLALQPEGNLFAELLASAPFEDVGKGRQGAVLVKPNETRGIPIVRTTTKYSAPAQCFQAVHTRLAEQIQKIASLPLSFNNALIENYTNLYTKMGFHSDQELDLDDASFIAVFSCYEHPELAPSRKLIVESKEPGGGAFEIPLTHNSVVVFSLDTNRRFRHKIVLGNSQPPENRWLGVTFRTSKTFVRFCDEQAFLADGTPLKLVEDDAQRREFYSLRRRENEEMRFSYPRLHCTISTSDLKKPTIAAA